MGLRMIRRRWRLLAISSHRGRNLIVCDCDKTSTHKEKDYPLNSVPAPPIALDDLSRSALASSNFKNEYMDTPACGPAGNSGYNSRINGYEFRCSTKHHSSTLIIFEPFSLMSL